MAIVLTPLPAIRRALLWTNLAVLLVALVYGLIRGKPGIAFSEDGFVTDASGWQLMLSSLVALLIGGLFCRQQKRWISVDLVFWLLLTLGFSFLAFDEFYMVHESMDQQLHHLLGLNETPWTDRLDDLIVGVYVGCGVLIVSLASRVKSFTLRAKRMVSLGLVVAVLMVALDVITNGPELMNWMFGVDLGGFLRTWLSVLEDGLKLTAVFLFLNGLLINLEQLSLQTRGN